MHSVSTRFCSMTVLCWNTTWISVHSSYYNIFNFFTPPSGIFNRGFKIIIIIIIKRVKKIIKIIIIILEAGHSIEYITHDGHSITFLHFVTLWLWPLTFWSNINWRARYHDGLYLCQVWRFYCQPFSFYCADRHKDSQNHRITDADDRYTQAPTVGVSNNNNNVTYKA